MDPDTFRTLDSGERGPTTREGSNMQGKRLRLYCEIGQIKSRGGVATRLTAHVFDVQLREFLNRQEVLQVLEVPCCKGRDSVSGCCHLDSSGKL